MWDCVQWMGLHFPNIFYWLFSRCEIKPMDSGNNSSGASAWYKTRPAVIHDPIIQHVAASLHDYLIGIRCLEQVQGILIHAQSDYIKHHWATRLYTNKPQLLKIYKINHGETYNQSPKSLLSCRTLFCGLEKCISRTFRQLLVSYTLTDETRLAPENKADSWATSIL